MQGNDFVQSLMYTRGVTCFSCHDVHGTGNNADLIKPASAAVPDVPRPDVAERSARRDDRGAHASRAGSAGSECVACHMPKIEQTIADVNVRSHTFKFITPAMTDQYKIPNSCNTCHTDKTTDWARQALKDWPNVSPWP